MALVSKDNKRIFVTRINYFIRKYSSGYLKNLSYDIYKILCDKSHEKIFRKKKSREVILVKIELKCMVCLTGSNKKLFGLIGEVEQRDFKLTLKDMFES